MSYKVEKDWITMAGLRAVIIQGTDEFYHRCGYVGLDENHPLFKKEYSEKCECLKALWEETKKMQPKHSPILVLLAACKSDDDCNTPELALNVHGGITYSGGCNDYPVKSELWWFGFDCNHYGDYSVFDPSGKQWSVEDVAKECEQLANQLSAVCSISQCESEE